MPDLLNLSASFARHLRAEGKSSNTVRSYLNAVRYFSAWLQGQGYDADLDQLNKDQMVGWLADLTERLAPNSVLTHRRGLSLFAAWLIAEGELTGPHPADGIAHTVVPEEPPPILTDEQLAALIKACSGRAFNDRRDEALIRSLLDTGVRVSELCGWTMDGVDLDTGCVLVTGKGGKKRMVYFGTRTTRALDRYVRLRGRHRWAHLDAFWLGERGAMTTNGVRKRMTVRVAQAGLDDPANPHRFRHTFAHDFLLAGGDRGDLKRLAGWKSDVMLDRYGASGADHRAMLAAKRLRRGDRV